MNQALRSANLLPGQLMETSKTKSLHMVSVGLWRRQRRRAFIWCRSVYGDVKDEEPSYGVGRFMETSKTKSLHMVSVGLWRRQRRRVFLWCRSVYGNVKTKSLPLISVLKGCTSFLQVGNDVHMNRKGIEVFSS